MSSKSLVKILIMCSGLGHLSTLEASEVRATVDANSIGLNDVFTFKVEAIDAEKTPSVDISPLLGHFTIVSGPGQQTNVQWVNGRMTSSRSLTWTLVAKRAGKLTIPSLPVTVGLTKYKTKPIQMKVQVSGVDGKKEDLYIAVDVNKRDVYLGEQVTVTYKLYTRVNMSLQSIDYPKGTGFWIEDLRKPSPPRYQDTQVAGVRYKVTTLYTAALFPTKVGELTFNPMSVNCNVEVGVRRSRDPFFESPFFDSFFKETIQKVVRSEPVIISVKPFPPGKPSNFTGAVGSFSLESSMDTDHVSVNEAITVKVRLKGTGNLNLFSPPDIDFPADVDVLPPTSSFEKESLRDELTGTMNWEYILIPRSAGLFYLPKIELAYFNPPDATWKVTLVPQRSITVEKGKNVPESAAGLSREEVRLLAEDIRYIRTEIPIWKNRNSSGIPIVVWLTYGLALLLFIAPTPMERLRTNYVQTAGLRQSRSALKTALKSLKGIREDTYSQTSFVVYRYLKEKFFLVTEVMDQVSVSELLEGKVDDSLIDNLIYLMNKCDEGRFAPGGADVQSKVVEEAKEILKNIDKNIR